MKNEIKAWENLFSQTIKLNKILRIFVFAAILIAGSLSPLFSAEANTLQGRQVSGKVTDNSGITLPGVTVVEKGTTNGSITNIDGIYTITVDSDDAILQFSFVGMETLEVEISGQSTIDVQMVEGTIGLEEVIAIGYGSMERNNVTGAISSIKAEELTKAPVPNLVEAMRGQVSGVKISRASGQPGSGVDFTIRGKNSLSSGNDPLIVIDGVPLTGGNLGDINPSDIASINILKDAAAASIYGASGANGVVLITTKNGTSGKATFSVQASSGVVDLSHLPEMYDADGYVKLKRDVALGQYGGDTETAFSKVDTSLAKILTDPVEYANYMNGKQVNWHDVLLRQGNTKNISISLSGGTDKFHYYMNGDAYLEKGIAEASDYNRYSFRLNADYSPYKFLTVGAKVQMSKSTSDETGLTLGYWGGADFGAFVGNTPLGRMYNDDGDLVPTVKGDQFQYNPLYRYRESQVDRNRTRVYVNPFIEFKILDGLTYRINTFAEQRVEQYNQFYSSVYGISGLENEPGNNEMTVNFGETMTYLWDNIVNYRKIINEVHSVDATLVYGIQTYDKKQLDTSGEGAATDLLGYWALSGVTNDHTIVSYTPDNWGKEYYVGRLGYSYNETYNLTLTVRRDGSSKFGVDTRYGTFPSVAGAWNMHNESFLSTIPMIDVFKFRASYGIMGNDNIPNFEYMSLTQDVSYPFNGAYISGKTTQSAPNSFLKWEESNQFNTGIDFGLLNSRINGSIDYYITNTTDLLLTEQLPITTGYSSVLSNVGHTQNWGIDASLNYDIINSGDFRWSMSVNWAKDQNKIISLSRFDIDEEGNPIDDITNGWFIGEDIDVIYDYKFNGIYQYGEEELAATMHPNIRRYGPGDPKIADINDDGVIDTNDRTFVGSPTPDWYGGMRNTFTYKGVELTILLETVQGLEKVNGYYGNLTGRNNQIAVDYWTPDNPSNVFPQPNPTDAFNGFGDAIRLRDASFVSLRNVSLGYTFPKQLLKNGPVKNVSLFLKGNNLKYFTKYKDAYSPEIDPWNFPITKTWTFSAKITF